MKRLAALALIAVWIALPVCAQRSGSHGGFSGHASSGFHSGFSGHAAPASHGGFRASASSRIAGTTRSTGSRPHSVVRSSPRGAGISSARPRYTGIRRPPYTGARRYRRPYLSIYGTGVPYVYPGWVGPYPYGYSDTTGSDDSQAASNATAEGYDAQPAEPYQPPPLEPWQPNAGLTQPSPAPGSEVTVTLIFKDGRPPEQIHNYLLTRTTLYVGDPYHRDIPTSQLDLAATAKVNHDAGVDFHLPETP